MGEVGGSGRPDHRCGDDRLNACPACVHRKLRQLEPGDRLVLEPGLYDRPVTLDGVRGSRRYPIVLAAARALPRSGFDPDRRQPNPNPVSDCVFTTGDDVETFRRQANEIALRKQRSGEFPGLYYIADESAFLLRDCQHVRIESLWFDRCWPTAIYLDNCQEIDIRDCQFRWGTYAIGAAGRDTRHILVERCRWWQFPDNHGLWKKVTWASIHGEPTPGQPDSGVQAEDWRMLDGDFFCGWLVAGFVTIRDCVVEDAFNAIHFFGENGARFDDRVNLNVTIEGNRFTRIRDNAVEPEICAWNWVVRHNVFVDVYRWFSFELERSGWFYLYGNLGWHTGFPGQPIEKKYAGSLLKLPETGHEADGPHYIFHNSFHLRENFAAKGMLRRLRVFNNAWSYARTGPPDENGERVHDPVLFAKKLSHLGAPKPAGSGATAFAGEHFTKLWGWLGIAFHDNVIAAPPALEVLLDAGFAMGQGSVAGPPDFASPSPDSVGDFVPRSPGNLAGRAGAVSIELPDASRLEVAAGRDIGALDQEGRPFKLCKEFAWTLPREPEPEVAVASEAVQASDPESQA